MFLMIDNKDSFVWNLVRYLELAGAEVEIRRNDQLDFAAIDQAGYQGIILSPGPGTPAAAGHLLPLIKHYRKQMPMLGVCLGHQAIAEVCGARIICAHEPKHGKLSAVHHDGLGVFCDLPNPLTVTHYHSLIVERASLPAELIISCESADGTIMGLRHMNDRMEGIQFHPEAELTVSGLALIRNFVQTGCRV